MVIDALKDVDPDRRCFRMVGGVLAERTVKDVLPALHHTLEQVCTFNDEYNYIRVLLYHNIMTGSVKTSLMGQDFKINFLSCLNSRAATNSSFAVRIFA